MIAPGDRPDDFTLLDQDGQPVAWSGLRGRPVVVFFYPKASTPGCTTEACDFRDLKATFEEIGVAVLGVSADPVKRQRAFATAQALNMPLLADPDKVVLGPWGVFGEKMMYGKVVQGIVRTTVLFDADGVARRVWTKVKVAGHADEVLAAARALAG